MISGLCYPLWPIVPPMVLLGARRQEPFVHFHALQGLALGVLSVAGAGLLVGLMWLILQVLPGGSPAFSGVIGLMVFSGGFLVLGFYLSFLLYTAWRASAGRFLRLPFLGSWAEGRMQANLDLSPEDYDHSPLSSRAFEGPDPAASEPPEPLIRRHRPSVGAHQQPAGVESQRSRSSSRQPSALTGELDQGWQDFQPGLLPQSEEDFQPGLLPQREADFQPGLLPQSEDDFQPGLLPQREEDFQPGLLPQPGAPSGQRRFKWEPLDPEEEEDSAGDEGFRAW